MKIPTIRPLLRPRNLATLAIAAGALLAFVLPVSADVSTDSPSVAAIRVESPATLEARGAAITLPVTAVCTPGANGFVNAEVTQRVGGDIARGFGSAQLTCTGRGQTITLTLTAMTSPFRKGPAFATASLFVQTFPSGSATDQRDIEIVR